ncbi:MAG TPA: response regulator [bacterium]|nr:response regulator [bacterium]
MKKKVLLVDDDQDVISALQTVLESKGFQVEAAFEGPSGLKKAKAEKPDLIVLDVMLPDLDGMAVCHALKKDPSTRHIPVLILTSLSESDRGINAARLIAEGHGAEGYLEKPVEPRLFMDHVYALLNPKRKKGRRVLLVDDDPDFVETLRVVLADKGYEVITAHAGDEGFETALKERPDIVLLDIMLPVKDGYEVCQEIKEHKDLKMIPVIMLTSIGRKLTEPGYGKIMAQSHQADDYIEKPVEVEELLRRIRKFLKSKNS